MRRISVLTTLAFTVAVSFVSMHAQTPVSAGTDGGYRLVPNWPTLPAGMYLRLEGRAAAAGRTRSAGRGAARTGGQQRRGARAAPNSGPTNQPGISGLAIDQQDRIYVFNRGPKPVMVFDRDGKLVMSGADQEINGKKINPDWQHSGDGRLGRQRLHHRARRASHREAESEAGQVPDAARHHRARRATTPRTSICRRASRSCSNGNIVVTDGYGNNRVRAVRQERQVHQAGRQGRRRPRRQGHRPGRMGSCRTSSPSTRRRTSTSSTARTSASRCSTRT